MASRSKYYPPDSDLINMQFYNDCLKYFYTETI
jgi:hypothetical protein